MRRARVRRCQASSCSTSPDLPPSTELTIVSTTAEIFFQILSGDPLYETDRKKNTEKPVKQSRPDAYSSDWRHFAQWCAERWLVSLPAHPDTVGLYITYLACPQNGEKPLKAATISRWLTSISTLHAKQPVAKVG